MSEGNGSRKIEWEPGDLSTWELRQILTDVLADLWGDAYRRGDRGDANQLDRFIPLVEDALYCSTGKRLRVRKGGE